MQARKDRSDVSIDVRTDETEARSGAAGRASSGEAGAAPEGLRFEGIRELIAETHAAPDARNGALLESIRIACQAGGVAHSGAYCKQCTRFVNWVPSPDRSSVTIRCLWRESDLAGDLMACTSALVTTPPDTPMSKAAAEARRLGTPYLLVESDGRFEGVVLLPDMPGHMEDGGLVRDRMIRPTWRVPPSATLGEVVTIMRAQGTDFVPVVVDEALLGLITWADLVDAGLEVALGSLAPPAQHEA